MLSKQSYLIDRARFTVSLALILSFALGFGAHVAAAPKPYAKAEPVRLDFDMESIPEPQDVETGYLYDWVDNMAFQQVKQGFDVPRHMRNLTGRRQEALNVNTFDEVPDSSWFTNRNGRRTLSLAEIKQGPDQTAGPAPGELTVIRAKTIGAAPGFWVRDRVGQIYILKFDPPDNPELMTGAEVIATKLFHAIGYHVPQNTIFRFRRERVRVGKDAKLIDEQNRKRLMTEADLDSLLQKVARQQDGQYRSIASLLLAGKPKGGFTFAGLRKDDPNDIIPHELRRDLRALRIFSAWLNHDDIRVGNTLDMYVTEGGRQFLRHYLIDFGSTFGSHTTRPNPPEVGHEHVLDMSTAAKVLLSAGLYQPAWRSERHDPVRSPAVGRYSARDFNPSAWKGNFSLVAFEEMTERDAFWAAQIIASFTPEQLAAAIELGEFSSPADAEYLTREIIRRQRIIVGKYARKRAGLANFRVARAGDASVVSFSDYRINYSEKETARAEFGGYTYRLQTVGQRPQLLIEKSINETRLTLSPDLVSVIRQSGTGDAEGAVAELLISQAGERQTARVYLHAQENGGLRIIGVRL